MTKLRDTAHYKDNMLLHSMATKLHNAAIRNIHKVRLKFDTKYRENHEYMVKRMAEVLREVLKEKE